MKRLIKIAYTDFWSSADFDNIVFTKALREIADVRICNNVEDADYVIYSVFGFKHLDIPDRCISIMYTGENICPDFNLCDYALGFEYVEFGDRYLRFPVYLVDGDIQGAEKKHLAAENLDLKKDKVGFCSFVVSNLDNANPIKRQFFEELGKYKTVSSGGRCLNNVGGPVTNKKEFEAKHKFCLVFENSSHSGYTTEKIVDAFAACSVPIYWGDPDVSKVFNDKAFINVMDFPNIGEAINKIKEIDNDNSAYMDMLREPALVSDVYSYAHQYELLEDFLYNIISQPKEEAMRRNREFRGKMYVEQLRQWRDKSAQAGLKNAIIGKLPKVIGSYLK